MTNKQTNKKNFLPAGITTAHCGTNLTLRITMTELPSLNIFIAFISTLLKARFHYELGKKHSLLVLLFFALASILTARFNRRSIKERMLFSTLVVETGLNGKPDITECYMVIFVRTTE